jgi:hypothetical protein
MSKTVQYYYKKQKDFAKAMEVKNNLLTLHALDYAIVVPSDSKEGFYTNILENIIDENPIDDFIDALDHNYVDKFTINIKDLKWVAQAMSIEKIRYYLCGIHVLNGVLTATDGHRLHRITEDSSINDDIAFIIPSAAINIITKLSTEYNLKKVTIQYSQPEKKSNRISIRLSLSENICVDIKSVDGQFPDCQRIIPHDYKSFPLFQWNGFTREQTKEINKVLTNKVTRVVFYNDAVGIDDNDLRIPYDGIVATKDNAFCLPYLNNIGTGRFYFNREGFSPSVLENGNRFALIMPIRI